MDIQELKETLKEHLSIATDYDIDSGSLYERHPDYRLTIEIKFDDETICKTYEVIH